MSRRIERAKEILAEIRDILDLAGLEDVATTIKAQEIPAAALRAGVVAIGPPDITWENRNHSETAWTLVVVAGPVQDTLAAWATLDAIVDALAEWKCLDKATAGGYASQGASLPCYTITTTDD